MPRKSNSVKEQELIAEVKDFFAKAEGADSKNRQAFSDDLRFCYVPMAQWDQNALIARKGRPCYSYNRAAGSVNQVTGDQRQARAGGKVRPTNRLASQPVADIYGGMIRNIESCSSAQRIYDRQFKYAVAGGFGAWRIVPKYCDERSFDQELEIIDIPNPLTVSWDPSAQDPCKRDQMQCFVGERISIEHFKAQYPGFEPDSIETSRDNRGWITKDEVRVGEYFKKIAKRKRILLLSDGRVIDSTPEVRKLFESNELQGLADVGLANVTIEDEREVTEWIVRWWKVDGCQILEGPIDYKYKFIPVVRVPGRFVNIEGEQILSSLIRPSKDSQRSYNYNRSTMVELTSLTPRAPYIGTAKMFSGHETQWDNANKVNRPYLVYNIDEKAPNARPTREPPPDVPQALIALAAQDAEDIKQTTGYTNPASIEGSGGTDESGRALIQRSRVGDSASYEFVDGLEMAIQLTWEMCIDMIPKTYTGPRLVRVLGEDDVEAYKQVNQVDDDGLMVALDEGSYGVTVTMGPAYATARMESLNTMLEALDRMPSLAEIAPDLLAKNLDVEGSEEIYKRYRRKLIQAGVVAPDEQEVAEGIEPPAPDPTQEALVQRLQAQTAKDSAAAAKTTAEMQMLPVDLEAKIADIVNKRLDALSKAGQMAAGSNAAVAGERAKATDGAPQT